MLSRGMFLVLFTCFLSNHSIAGTITVSPYNPDPISTDELLMTTYETEIFIDGNLYLDFSLWGNVGGIDSSDHSSFSITAPDITLLGETQEPPILLDYEVLFFDTTPMQLSLVGNYILFSEFTIPSSSFISTESICVGDFSQYAPVPIPSAAFLFASGVLGLVRYRRHINYCSDIKL